MADKGLDYITTDLQTVLENQIKNYPMTKSTFKTYLETLLSSNQYACNPNKNATSGLKIPAEDNSFTYVCIESVEPVTNEHNVVADKDLYKRKVTFKSIGIVDGVEKVVKSEVIFGTDLIPDQLKYAVSTNKKGNLYLHGGIQIIGDVRTDGHLIISDHATWMSGSTAKWQPSVSAQILKGTDTDLPKIIMQERKPIETGKPDPNKYIYVLKNNNRPSYNDHIDAKKLNESNRYTKIVPSEENTNLIQQQFFNSNNLKVVTKSSSVKPIISSNAFSTSYWIINSSRES